MAARARKPRESFKAYHRNLTREEEKAQRLFTTFHIRWNSSLYGTFFHNPFDKRCIAQCRRRNLSHQDYCRAHATAINH